MNSNYNPFDPRSPYFPLTLSMMEDNGSGRRPRGPRRGQGCGCGCLLVAAALLIAILLLNLHG